MRWVQRFSSLVTPTFAWLVAIFASAASSFLYLGIVVSTERPQVSERVASAVSAAYATIDSNSGPTFWRCASVPATVQCGRPQLLSSWAAVEAARQ